jgi:Zn-dependent M28 family amino/carboxypeptidase
MDVPDQLLIPILEPGGEWPMSQQNPFASLDRRIVGDCYTSTEAMDNLVHLCDDFGSRFGGTDGEHRAAEFLKAKMEEYGLHNVRLEPVEYVGWTRGQATLEIISPVEKIIPCISLPHSPPATLEGTIVDVGDGAPQDFDSLAGEIKGKVVMTTSVVSPRGSKRWIHRSEKYGRSLLAGATGFIFVNHYPGYGPATGGIGHDGEALIPGLSISKEDGAYIRRLAKRSGQVQIRLTSTDRSRPMTSWNVIGELPGEEQPGQIVMLGSHYDGHDISQGAEDPASGVVSVLEAARLLAQYAPSLPCTMRFAFWGVEEIGLLGSRAYVAAHAAELDRVRFYLNMDSAGTRDNKRDIVLNDWPGLQPLFEAWSDEMAQDFAVAQRTSASSDHFPFFMAGVPTAGMQSADLSLAGRGYGHTRYDTVDKVDLASLREASTLAARLALRLASAEDWPVARRSKESVLQLLDTPEYEEEQALRARVDAYYLAARQS